MGRLVSLAQGGVAIDETSLKVSAVLPLPVIDGTSQPPPAAQWNAYALQLFGVADTHQSGVINGADAVSFFLKSGLPSNALHAIWELCAEGQPYLDRNSFVNAIRAIAFYQICGYVPPYVAGLAEEYLPYPRIDGIGVGAPTTGVQPEQPTMSGQSSPRLQRVGSLGSLFNEAAETW